MKMTTAQGSQRDSVKTLTTIQHMIKKKKNQISCKNSPNFPSSCPLRCDLHSNNIFVAFLSKQILCFINQFFINKKYVINDFTDLSIIVLLENNNKKGENTTMTISYLKHI